MYKIDDEATIAYVKFKTNKKVKFVFQKTKSLLLNDTSSIRCCFKLSKAIKWNVFRSRSNFCASQIGKSKCRRTF